MGSRREPAAAKGVKLIPVKIGEIPCEWHPVRTRICDCCICTALPIKH
jgi:hypothetical protein